MSLAHDVSAHVALQAMGVVLLGAALLMWAFDEEAAVALAQRGAGLRPAVPAADATPLLPHEAAAAPPAARPGVATAARGPEAPRTVPQDAKGTTLGGGGVATDGAAAPPEPLDTV